MYGRMIDTPLLRTTAAIIVEILHADSHILITDEFLHEVNGRPSESVRLDNMQYFPPKQPSRREQALVHAMQTKDRIDAGLALLTIQHDAAIAERTPDEPFEGALLHINAGNRKLVYRIGKYRRLENAWEAAWPD